MSGMTGKFQQARWLLVTAVIVLVLVGAVLFGQALLNPGVREENFSSVESLQMAVIDWYSVLYPSVLPSGMLYTKSVLQPDHRDASLIFECRNYRLYVIHEFGYNGYYLPPGYTGDRLPDALQFAPVDEIRDTQGGYTEFNGYQILVWTETEVGGILRLKLLAQPQGNSGLSASCTLDKAELIAIANGLMPLSVQ